jgi:lipoprotein-anchoring transpeptidase ErfK/SrfK
MHQNPGRTIVVLAFRPRNARVLRRTALSGCVVAAAAACSSAGVGTDAVVTNAVVSVSPTDGRSGIRPDTPVRVRIKHGRMLSVSVTDAGGSVVSGAYSPDHTSWSSRRPLRLAAAYNVVVQAVDAQQHPLISLTSFRTVVPAHTLKAKIAPLNGETVGVGMPIAVYFTAPVKNRAVVEKRFRVTAEKAPPGAWHWFSATEMHYRPPTYWPAHDHVTLRYDINAVDAGDGVWGAESRTIAFTIGTSHVSKVDAATHSMQVYADGKLVRTLDVSTGRDQYPTTSGVHVVTDKRAVQIMDSSTIGIPRNAPGGYYLHVPNSVRISYSGEFVHAASWSVRDQGHRNVSHGCINISPANAAWFFQLSRRGDIVQVSGTPRRLQQGNGYADWNLSWSDWTSGDAGR